MCLGRAAQLEAVRHPAVPEGAGAEDSSMLNLDEIPLRSDFTLSARISLFALDEAHIDLRSSPHPEDELFAEQLLYCCMALRQLVNMTGNPQVHTLEHHAQTSQGSVPG